MKNKDSRLYFSVKQFLFDKFGENVYKIAVNGGFSCPNRDIPAGKAGCIFCSPNGSGDFAGNSALSIHEQLYLSQKGIHALSSNHGINKYIAYFQAYTNTYAPIPELRQKYYEALSVPGVVGLAVATRPDCLSKEVLALLDEINRKTFLWVELGLQTIHQKTAEFINRGFSLTVFNKSLKNLNSIGIDTVCHLIFGLPGESREDMLKSVRYISEQDLQGVKLHLLHVLEGTPLAEMYHRKIFNTLTKEEYVNIVVEALELMPSEFVIHRLTGDGPKNILIAPDWSRNKRDVLNSIHKELRLRNSWQGKLFNRN